MPVALVHYHLRRGGVTRVVESQSEALRRAGREHVILAGTPCRGRADLPVITVPDLDYRVTSGPADGAALAGRLRHAARLHLGRDPEIWHLHNPTLGKNSLLPGVVRALSESCDPLVLQFHDFAEDGRPANYRLLCKETEIYPLAPQIRYVFINRRDQGLLEEAGVPPACTSLLPNAVRPPVIGAPPAPPGLPARVLYPVRGIRRKNLGEFCLLAGLAPSNAAFALTLAPENPEWRPIYDQWTRFAADHRLPASFNVVDRLPPAPNPPPTYESWLSHCSHLLTTSIAEGFGLAFLEPVALRKPLLGRNLPEITTDFTGNSEPLGSLYEHLLIPAGWIDRDRLLAALSHGLRAIYDAYRTPFSAAVLDAARNALFHDNLLDFGNLPEPLQREAAVRALRNPEGPVVTVGGRPEPAVRWLARALSEPPPLPPPSLLDPYDLDHHAARLGSIYDEVRSAGTRPPSWLPAEAVLRSFLKPRRFHFLRT